MNKPELEALQEELDEALAKAFPVPEPMRASSREPGNLEDLRRRRMEMLAALPQAERETSLAEHNAKMSGKPRIHIITWPRKQERCSLAANIREISPKKLITALLRPRYVGV